VPGPRPSGAAGMPGVGAILFSFLPLVPLLVWVPTLVPVDATVQSEATAQGYNSTVAYQVAAGWCAVVFAVWWALGRRRVSDAPALLPPSAPPVTPARRWLERVLLVGIFTAGLWPWALAPRGTYIEDAIFVNAAHRMLSGLAPFRDFEFLYGPLMVVPLAPWMRLTGFSLESYYGYLLLTELAGWLALLVFLQRVTPAARLRFAILALAAALLTNPLLGLNYAVLRRLLPLAALLVLTSAPLALATAALGGALLGVALAYSHDTATAAGIGAAAMFAFVAWQDGVARVWRPVMTFGVTAVATWLGLGLLLMGAGFADYLREAQTLVTRFSAGEAAFRFYWTVNAVAVFGLIVAGVAVAARGLAARTGTAGAAWGDRWFLAALVATIVQLKSGLNRADVWHLCGGVLPLAAAFALPLPRTVVRWTPAEGRAVVVGLVLLGATNLIGQAPIASYALRGWLAGWSAPRVAGGAPISTEAPAIEPTRAYPHPPLVDLARYLAEPSRRGQAVYFYGTLWGIGPRIGVPKRDPNNDDFLYSDERGARVGRWLDEARVPYVVMTAEAEARLFGRDGANPRAEFDRRVEPSLVKTIGAWTSSVHFTAIELEMPLQDARWRRVVGETIRQAYTREAVIGEYVVLRRTTP
jgi:hypothetical protein